jgi:hypothetical protein
VVRIPDERICVCTATFRLLHMRAGNREYLLAGTKLPHLLAQLSAAAMPRKETSAHVFPVRPAVGHQPRKGLAGVHGSVRKGRVLRLFRPFAYPVKRKQDVDRRPRAFCALEDDGAAKSLDAVTQPDEP